MISWLAVIFSKLFTFLAFCLKIEININHKWIIHRHFNLWNTFTSIWILVKLIIILRSKLSTKDIKICYQKTLLLCLKVPKSYGTISSKTLADSQSQSLENRNLWKFYSNGAIRCRKYILCIIFIFGVYFLLRIFCDKQYYLWFSFFMLPKKQDRFNFHTK